MIYLITPFAEDKNLGKAYNDYIRGLWLGRREDMGDFWICVTDYDTCWLEHGFYANMVDQTKKHGDFGILTCLTNRIGCPEQRYEGKISENGEMRDWYHVSKEVHSKPSTVVNIPKEISGTCMLFKYSVWKEIGGFKERPGRCLGIDNYFCWDVLKAGYKIGLMENVFIFHYYRLVQGIGNKQHLS